MGEGGGRVDRELPEAGCALFLRAGLACAQRAARAGVVRAAAEFGRGAAHAPRLLATRRAA
jgi:hypothetical protein